MELKTRAEYLVDWITQRNYKRIAEIGVSAGCTSQYILEHCKLDYYLLVDFDPQGSFEYDRVKRFPEAKFVRIKSKEAIVLVSDGSLDLVFIDAEHTYKSTKEDILLWFPKVKKGGILCGHDYDEIIYPEVIKAVDESIPDKQLLLENTLYKKDFFSEAKMSSNIWWKEV